MKAPRTNSESLLPTSGMRKIGSQGGVQLCLRVARLKPPLVLKPTHIINSSFLIHTLPFASRSHLSIVPTRLSLESIAAHKFCYNPSPSSGAQAHYERHPPQLSKCSPPPLNLARRKRGAGPAPAFCAPYLQTLSRGPLWTRPNLMGVVSGLSIVEKRSTRTTPSRRHYSGR